MEVARIKTAIIGFGKSAKIFHLPFLSQMPEYEIRAFVSSQRDELSVEYPSAIIYDSINELMNNKEIQLVIICSPTFLHYEQSKNLLMAGKHVVVEKPFTVNPEQAQELVKIANERKLKLSVYHNRRWDNGFLTLKKLVSENKLGEIYHYEVHYDRWRPTVQDRWREKNIEGSGILYDLGSHLIDQAFDLFGYADEIISDIQCQRKNSQSTDYFHLILKYGSMRAILHASSLVQAPRDHIVVHGTEASFIQETVDPQEAALMLGEYRAQENWGYDKTPGSKLLKLTTDGLSSENILTEQGSYQNFYQQMARAINYNEYVPVDPESVVKVIQLISEISRDN